MHNVHPQSAVIASRSPSEIVPNAEEHRCAGVAIAPRDAPSAPRYPHRHAIVESSWRAAHAWISRSHAGGLDAARPELATAYPELLANIDHLEHATHQAANLFQNTPAATPDAFQAALATWEAACLDACAALDHAQLEASPGHQLDLPQLRKLEAAHG